MNGRDAILGKLRGRLSSGQDDSARVSIVEKRLARPVRGVIPERGQLDPAGRVKLFHQKAEAVQATVETVKSPDQVPKAVASYIRARNLPAELRMGDDRRLKKMPWKDLKTLEVRTGACSDTDLVGLSHATAGIAETGTLMLSSGSANPVTISFLPEHHIIVINAADIDGDMESAVARLRKGRGAGKMPRTLNLITGPSRSADVEQKLLLGAHGPRALHVVIVEK